MSAWSHLVCSTCRNPRLGLLAVAIKGLHPCAVCKKIVKVFKQEGPAPAKKEPAMETYSEFVSRISALLPDAVFSEDDDGQIVVSTGYCSTREGFVVPFEGPHSIDATIVVVQPHGCDGSGKYAYDPKAEDGRGAKLSPKCPGCRACS